MAYVTVKQRDAAKLAALRQAIAVLREELGRYAVEHGGRILLFGSAARDELSPDSDIDLLLDFPNSNVTKVAWLAAESACAAWGIKADVIPVDWCDDEFLAHVLPEAIPLP